MTTKVFFQTMVLLSAPYILYGADDTRALLSAHQEDADDAISDIFDDLYTKKPSETTYALLGGASTVIGGATGVGTAVVLSRMIERTPNRFIDPFTAGAVSSVGLELFKAAPAAIGAFATLVAGYKFYGVFKAGIMNPLERKFDKLQHENAEFKAAVLKHQKEYEALTDELIAKKLEKAENDIKVLLSDWFKQIDETTGQVIGNLTEQERRLRALRARVSPVLYEEIDAIMSHNTQSAQKLASMHEISPETLDKYTKKHRKGAMARFFGGIGKIFHGKK